MMALAKGNDESLTLKMISILINSIQSVSPDAGCACVLTASILRTQSYHDTLIEEGGASDVTETIVKEKKTMEEVKVEDDEIKTPQPFQ